MKAIETSFAGTKFRSRLEAKWASFFTHVGWEWEYEPFDANGYIPDFVLLGVRPVLVEVKPLLSKAEFGQHMDKIDCADTGETDVLIVGTQPFWVDDGGLSIGLLGENIPQRLNINAEHWWSAGIWHRCVYCNSPAFHSAMVSMQSRPCGHYDGNSYLGQIGPIESHLREYWAKARNETQWHRS